MHLLSVIGDSNDNHVKDDCIDIWRNYNIDDNHRCIYQHEATAKRKNRQVGGDNGLCIRIVDRDADRFVVLPFYLAVG